MNDLFLGNALSILWAAHSSLLLTDSESWMSSDWVGLQPVSSCATEWPNEVFVILLYASKIAIYGWSMSRIWTPYISGREHGLCLLGSGENMAWNVVTAEKNISACSSPVLFSADLCGQSSASALAIGVGCRCLENKCSFVFLTPALIFAWCHLSCGHAWAVRMTYSTV